MAVNVIRLAEIRRLLNSGKTLDIIDVRTPGEFAGVHVVGAKLMPLDDLDPVAVAGRRAGSKEPVYVICQAGGRAAKACERLMEAGVDPVYSIEGGTSAWERAGLPVERGGSKVISMERQVRIGAGSIVVIGIVLARWVHPLFLVVSAFVGVGLVFAGITDTCGMAIALGKMPWNRRHANGVAGAPVD